MFCINHAWRLFIIVSNSIFENYFPFKNNKHIIKKKIQFFKKNKKIESKSHTVEHHHEIELWFLHYSLVFQYLLVFSQNWQDYEYLSKKTKKTRFSNVIIKLETKNNLQDYVLLFFLMVHWLLGLVLILWWKHLPTK